MKNSRLTIKNLSLVIFLFTILPYGKLEMFNGIIIIINLTLIFTKNALSLIDYIFLFSILLGVYFIFFYKNKNVMIGFLFTYMWLAYKVSWNEFINSLTVSLSIIIYLSVSIYTSIKILKQES